MSEPAFPEASNEGPIGEFYTWLRNGEVRLQYCAACERWLFPPRWFCPGSSEHVLAWKAIGGQGRILTWTVTHRAFHPAFAKEVPYINVVVEVLEGPRLFARLDSAVRGDVLTGLPVRLAPTHCEGELRLLGAELG